MNDVLELREELHKLFEANKDLSNIEHILSQIKKIYGEEIFIQAINENTIKDTNLEEKYFFQSLHDTSFLTKYLFNAEHFNCHYNNQNNSGLDKAVMFLVENGIDLLTRNQKKYQISSIEGRSELFAIPRIYNNLELIIEHILPKGFNIKNQIIMTALNKIDILDQETIKFIFTSSIAGYTKQHPDNRKFYDLLFSKIPSLTSDTLYHIINKHRIDKNNTEVLQDLIIKTEQIDKKTLSNIMINYINLSDFAFSQYNMNYFNENIQEAAKKSKIKM